MKAIKQIALGIIAVELALATLFVVGLMVPLPGKVEFKIVQSGSMEPALPVGSVVVIVPQAVYAAGDIITFGEDTAKRIPTTHRIAGIEREAGSVRFVTKGDANEEADNGRVGYSDVVGKVVLSVPRLGYVLDFARSKNGSTFMIVVPALLIVLDEVLSIVATVRGARRAKRHVAEEVVPIVSYTPTYTPPHVVTLRTLRMPGPDARYSYHP